MIDLTEYTDRELSLVVFNDQDLYSMRHDDDFIDFLSEYFTFTPCQLLTLVFDLETDLEGELL
jgi:hypothetical protein